MKSVKVIDMSASDINENFLSNIALIRRLSTFKNSKAAHRSPAGAPEVQLCSIVEPRNDLFEESIDSRHSKAGSIVAKGPTLIKASDLSGDKQPKGPGTSSR